MCLFRARRRYMEENTWCLAISLLLVPLEDLVLLIRVHSWSLNPLLLQGKCSLSCFCGEFIQAVESLTRAGVTACSRCGVFAHAVNLQ